MRSTNKRLISQDDLFDIQEKRGAFSRARALKIKRELRRLAHS